MRATGVPSAYLRSVNMNVPADSTLAVVPPLGCVAPTLEHVDVKERAGNTPGERGYEVVARRRAEERGVVVVVVREEREVIGD
jgi:hypothetical protein